MTTILLLGDSLVADHNWQTRMSSFKVMNFGVPGATAGDLLASLPAIKTRASHADVILVMIGTNDLLMGNDDYLLLLKKILIQLNHDYPASEIVVNSLLPMTLPHLPQDTVTTLNSHIEALTMRTGCCFLDIHRRFVVDDQQLFQDDGVHLTDAGYVIWTRALMEHIAFLVEND
jgi:lysophospholipase L1-like esterase